MLHVSGAVIAAMIFLLLICFLLPMLLYYLLFRFADARIKTLAIGAAVFFACGFCLELILYNVINNFVNITQNMPVYFVYNLLLSPAMFLLMNFFAIKFFGKDMLTTGDSITYSTGYIGLQNIMSIGVSACSSLISMLSINSSAGYVVVSDSNYASYSDVVSASNLVSQSTYDYLVTLSNTSVSQIVAACVDRLWLIAAYSAILLVIWLAVRKTGGLPLLAVAFGMRLLITIPTILSGRGVVVNLWISVLMVVVLIVILWATAVACWKKFIDRDNVAI